MTLLSDDIVVRDDGKLALPSDGDPAVSRVLGARTLTVGLDIAMQRDRTAWTLVERVIEPYWVDSFKQALKDPVMTVLAGDYVEADDYHQLVQMIHNLMAKPELKGAKLVADKSGPGAAWCDAFAAHPRYQKNLVRVQITGGEKATDQGTHFNVARNKLLGDLGVSLQNNDLRLADFPRRDDLKTEIEGLTLQMNASGQRKIAGGSTKRGASHADLVMSLGLAHFVCTHPHFYTHWGPRKMAGLV